MVVTRPEEAPGAPPATPTRLTLAVRALGSASVPGRSQAPPPLVSVESQPTLSVNSDPFATHREVHPLNPSSHLLGSPLWGTRTATARGVPGGCRLPGVQALGSPPHAMGPVRPPTRVQGHGTQPWHIPLASRSSGQGLPGIFSLSCSSLGTQAQTRGSLLSR